MKRFTEKGNIFKNVQSLDRTSDAGQGTNLTKSKQVSVNKMILDVDI